MLTSCCQNCTKRYVGCHSKCEDYKQYKIENEKKKKYVNDSRETANQIAYNLKKGSTYYCKNKNK